jgi:hypothetical protein
MFIKNLLNKLPKKAADKKYFLQLDEAAEAKPAAAPKVEPAAPKTETAPAPKAEIVAEAPAPAANVETPAAPVAPAPTASKKSKPSAKAKAPAPSAKVEAPAAPKAEPVVSAKTPVKTVATLADYNQIPSNQFGDRRLPGANMASFLELARQVKTPN